MRDPYKVLGVERGAKEGDIKSAYRRLAKKFHPDANAGDEKAAQRFSEISAAHDLLKDKEKRGQFDRGEIDAEGNPKGFAGDPFAPGGPFAARGGRAEGFTGGFKAEDIFSELFGGARRARGQGEPFGGGSARGGAFGGGRDVAYTLSIPFVEAVQGTVRRVTLSGGRTLDVRIPRGVADGQQIRLRGQGEPGHGGGGGAGDALITVRVEPHPLFERDGDTLRLALPITLYEAVLGGKVRVPTPSGSVELTIPRGSSGGRTLRLKGRGVERENAPRGDLLVTLRIVLPETDLELETFLRKRSITKPYSVRGPEYD
jgi:DnaJ-class molecular chaperone